jgi:hypothetical protein
MGVAPGTASLSATIGGITAAASLTVNAAPIAISTGALPAGTQGTAYSATLAATGGTAPYAWAVVAGALPAGLSLTPATGAVTGTPTGTGTASFTVRVTGAAGETATKILSIGVSPRPVDVTLWPATAVPTRADFGADRSIEVGVKFRSDVAGVVKGIRFYKSAANTGTHSGSLWSSAGTRLANATFTGETASGWQEVRFATPVAIAASTVYVASYHAPTGHYANDNSYFATARDAPPLHALANGTSGANGVFIYNANVRFPSTGRTSTNFWVDVVFTPSPAEWHRHSATSPPRRGEVWVIGPARGGIRSANAPTSEAAEPHLSPSRGRGRPIDQFDRAGEGVTTTPT